MTLFHYLSFYSLPPTHEKKLSLTTFCAGMIWHSSNQYTLNIYMNLTLTHVVECGLGYIRGFQASNPSLPGLNTLKKGKRRDAIHFLVFLV